MYDGLLSAKNMNDIINFKHLLTKELVMKDLGSCKKVFDMKISRDKKNRQLSISQKKYDTKLMKFLGNGYSEKVLD